MQKYTALQLYSSHYINRGVLNSDYNQWPCWCIWIPRNCSHSHLPVWVLLFGQTLSRSCWQTRSSLGPSWFSCTPHRRAKTECSPHCTQTSGTPGKRSVRLDITGDNKRGSKCVSNSTCMIRRDSHLCSWGPCPQTHSKSQHPPVDPWGSNTIYPWKEHQDLSLAQLPVNSTANNACKPHWQAKLLIIHSWWSLLRWLVNIHLNAPSTWQQPPIPTSPFRNNGTTPGVTYSEWKPRWYFPHGCCKLLPAENGKGPTIKYAVTHFIAISSSSTKGDRDKILPDWRRGCDCLEIRESSDWANLNDPHPTWMEYMEICMQSAVAGKDGPSFPVCCTSRRK